MHSATCTLRSLFPHFFNPTEKTAKIETVERKKKQALLKNAMNTGLINNKTIVCSCLGRGNTVSMSGTQCHIRTKIPYQP